MANNVDKTYGHREVGNACLAASMHGELEAVNGEFDRSAKRRKVHHTMEPVASVSTHFKIGEKLSGFKNILNVAGGMTAVNCSQGDGISENFHNGIGCFSEDNNESCRGNINHSSNATASKQKISVLQTFGQNDIQKQRGKFDSERNRGPNVAEITLSSHALRGNSYIEQDGNVLSNVQADVISFENMIRGNCLKLLDLDNDADEERYMMAVQMPVSPTLPDFELPNHQLCVENDAQRVMERDKPVLFHSVDVMSTEIGLSNAALDLPSCEVQDSLHLTKDPGKTCAIKLQNCVRQHDRLDNDEDSPSLSDNHGPQDGEQMYPPGKSDDSNTIMVPFLERHDAFPNSDTSRDLVSDVVGKLLLSGDISGFYSLSDDGCLQSTTGKIDNYIGNESPVVNKQNKASGCVGTRNPDLVENQIDGKVDAPDGTIVYSSSSQVLTAEIKKCAESDKNIFNSEIAKQGSIHQLSEDSRQTALLTSCNAEDSSRTNPDDEVGRTPVCFVLFSNIKDKDSISRILHWRNAFSHQSFMVSETDHVVVQVHNTLAMDTVLLPEEKGCVFFSLLLCNISSRMSAKFGCTMSEHLLPCITSFAAEINKVLSDAETKSLFKEICQLDVLGSLVEEFLIERKVIVCSDRLYECNDTYDSFQLDGAYVCSRAATFDQFVAGCIILASISAAAKRIGFLLEASYRILRTCRNDVSWILLALHIFASVCGKEFFNIEEYSFLIIALRSVVLSLERGHQSVSSISPSVCSAFVREPSFPPCRECPFAMGAVCLEKLINLLMDVLQCYILSGDGYPNVNNTVNFSVCMAPSCTERDEESRGNKSELHGYTDASQASCCLFRFRKHAVDLPDCFPEKVFCHFIDIVSLVELVGCYMSWEWTYNKIISHLTKMLKSCKSEEFSAALFVLIGQLGRFGIDVGGHQKEGIAELRCIISVVVDSNMERKMSFPTQLAAIGSLLNLLPLSLRDVVGQYEEFTLDTSQSVHARLIKKWFSKLTKQQQSLSLNLF